MQSHISCIYAFFPEWIFKLLAWTEAKPHSLHLCDFFSEWVFKIVFKCLHKKMQSCFGYIVRFSNAALNCLPEEMQSYIDCNCMIFLQSVFSNVPSNHLPELMHSHIGKGTPPEKRIFSFGHCMNYLFPSFPPFRATCTSFLVFKNTNFDNHGCNDKKLPNNIQILRVLGQIYQF